VFTEAHNPPVDCWNALEGANYKLAFTIKYFSFVQVRGSIPSFWE
jgi:hypothetical protein